MRKIFALLAVAMTLFLSACGGPPVTIDSSGAAPQPGVIYNNGDDEYIDPQLLMGLTEDGGDYILISGDGDALAVTQAAGGYAAAALSAQPNLSLLVPHSGGQIARSLAQDASTLAGIAPQRADIAGLVPNSSTIASLAPSSSEIAGLAPNSTNIAQMAPNPDEDLDLLAPDAGRPAWTPIAQEPRDIVSGAEGVISGSDDVLVVVPNAGVAQPQNPNGAVQAVTPDGQAIIDAVESLEKEGQE